MLCSACPINPSALPSPEPGGGREGVSVESGRSCPPVPSAGHGASADPDNPLAGTDQAHSSVLTAVGPALSGIRAAVEDGWVVESANRCPMSWDSALRPSGRPGNPRRTQRGCPQMRV